MIALGRFEDIHMLGMTPCGECLRAIFLADKRPVLTYSKELALDVRAARLNRNSLLRLPSKQIS